jgi:hypothetical protein
MLCFMFFVSVLLFYCETDMFFRTRPQCLGELVNSAGVSVRVCGVYLVMCARVRVCVCVSGSVLKRRSPGGRVGKFLSSGHIENKTLPAHGLLDHRLVDLFAV